jgi:hypothetical protein
MKIELLQTIEQGLKSKKIDIIDILTLVEIHLHDNYKADDLQFVRLTKSIHNINAIMDCIESEHIDY